MDEYEPLAIVGLAFRFPGDADSPEEFWRIMEERRCVMAEMPADRINIDAFYHDDTSRVDTLNLRGGHFMKGELGAFDNAFFSISPAEASAMDPQQRGMLESSYHALENAGLPLKSVAGSKTAVFTASFSDDHRMLSLRDPELLSPYAGSSTAWSILANRLSWWYDFKGPSVHIDTACSSGLVALHLACQSLRNGESTMALVGGSNVLSSVEQFLFMSNLSMLSPSSRSYSFDHRANGYARGEGFGFVVVKKLSDALANGDTIRTIIRGTGVNQDGRTPSLTSPSQDAQEALIRETYRIAGLDPRETSFVEAHGTGTPVGDPIEARALGSVFGAARNADDPVYIGAVKSNIGHLEGGSGIAGLIKTILSLERATIPPNANFEKTNPSIDAKTLNITFPTESTPWPPSDVRRASVNCFGFGGTNAHAILDDACNYLRLHNMSGHHLCVDQNAYTISTDSQPASRPTTPLTPLSWEDLDTGHTQSLPKLLAWSASDEKGTHRLTQAFEQHFSKQSAEIFTPFTLDSLAYTLGERRTALPTRSFAVVDCQSDLSRLSKLASLPIKDRRPRKTCFVFTGQGAQYSQMGLQLLQYSVFRRSIEDADACMRALGCEWSLIDEITKTETNTRLDEPEFSQPICTALQVALVDQLASFGITPSMVVGHSSGEIAAAYAAGTLSSETAIKVAYLRGKVAAELFTSPIRGAMMAVGLSERESTAYVDQYEEENPSSQIGIACNNSPSSVTLAGDESAIEALKIRLEQKGIFARKLKISVAYHSPHVRLVSPLYRSLLGVLNHEGRKMEGDCTMISSVTGQILDSCQANDPEYWISNFESPVRFCEALEKTIKSHTLAGSNIMASVEPLDLLEIGPHSALKGPVKNIMDTFENASVMRYDTVMDRNSHAAHALLKAVGRLHCLGYPVNLLAANGLHSTSREVLQIVDGLPAYPFDHSTAQWHKSRSHRPFALRKEPRLDLLGLRMFTDGPPQMTQRWRKFTRVSETPWVRDHVVSGSVIYPAAGMICMAIEAAKQTADPNRRIKAYRLNNLELHRALHVPDDKDGIESQLELTPISANTKYASEARFVLCSLQDGTWVENCSGSIRIEYAVEGQNTCLLNNHDSESCTRSIDSTTLYEYFDTMGLAFGPSFRSLSDITIGSKQDACSTVDAFPYTASASVQSQEHVVHPITLDGIFQTILSALVQGGSKRAPTAVPTKLEELYIDGIGAASLNISSLKTYAKVAERTSVTTTSSASAWNATTGRIIVSVTGLETTFIDSPVDDVEIIEAKPEEHLCHQVVWEPDVDFIKYSETPQHLQRLSSDSQIKSHYTTISRSFSLMCAELLESFDRSSLTPDRPYLEIYLQWMQTFALQANAEDLEGALTHEVAQESVEGQGLVLAAQNLRGILSGEVDPVETIFKSNWAEQYYQMLNSHAQTALQHVIELIAFKNPGLKVLEIGAGTGSTTEHILEYAMLKGWGSEGKDASAITSYDFTDISPAFFPAAKTKFDAASSEMNFLVLDVSKDPLAQGFKANSYDLVVAANVLHATTNLNTTITNVRKLLKKGGKLVLFEITANQWLPQIMFGTLPGWWLSDDEYRTSGPCLTNQVWDEVLQRNGFSGTDIVLHDSDDPDCRMCSVIVGTAVSDEVSTKHKPSISIVIGMDDDEAFVVASTLKRTLELIGHVDIEVLSLPEAVARDMSGRLVVSMLEFTEPFLASMDEVKFYALRELLMKAKGLLWIRNTDSGSPDFQMSDGLLRVLRSENTGTRYVSYAVSATSERTVLVENVVRLVQDISSDEESEMELEFRELDGKLCIGRAMSVTDVNGYITSRVAPSGAALTSNVVCDLDPSATYVIVGGFGGIARSTCSWMARRGARHLLLLSRTGPSSTAAKELLSQLTSQGVRVECPTCDISDASQLYNVISNYAWKMPPIKGCIQGALVLRDSVFERMTYEQWSTLMSTRVQGTKNLRTLLPQAMDFFILLSSVNGLLGSVSQANYAAANTYMDAFAEYYSTPESPIISIDLGWMDFAGTVAESHAITQRIKDTKCVRPISEDQMCGLLDYYCDGDRARAATRQQISIGIQPQESSAGDAGSKRGGGYLDRPVWKHILFVASTKTRSSPEVTDPTANPTVSHTTQPEPEKRLTPAALLSRAQSLPEALHTAMQSLRWKIATDLGTPENDIDTSKPLHEAGVDSLLAVQIKSWVREEMRAEVSVFDIMGTKSVLEVCEQIAKTSKLVVVAAE